MAVTAKQILTLAGALAAAVMDELKSRQIASDVSVCTYVDDGSQLNLYLTGLNSGMPNPIDFIDNRAVRIRRGVDDDKFVAIELFPGNATLEAAKHLLPAWESLPQEKYGPEDFEELMGNIIDFLLEGKWPDRDCGPQVVH